MDNTYNVSVAAEFGNQLNELHYLQCTQTLPMFFKRETNPKVLISLDLQNLVLGLEDSKYIRVQIKFDCMGIAE